MFCAGSRSVDDRRVVSGLVLSIGCIIDITKSFADVGFTSGGFIITIGDFPFNIAVTAKKYPEEVFSCFVPSAFDAGTRNSKASFGYSPRLRQRGLRRHRGAHG